ncbi:MAG: hypothetical protein ACLF0P_16565, partial [Thermoanaerobaculia bacterium]
MTRPPSRAAAVAVTAGLTFGVAGAGDLAAQHPNHAVGFSPRNTFELGEIEHVNLLNGSLSLTLPIGGTYPVGPELSYSLTLTYSNNAAWMWEERPDNQGGSFLQALPRHQSNAGLGWTLSLGGRLIVDKDPLNASPHPVYQGRDQGFHELPEGPLHTGGQLFSGTHFSRDSSYLRYRPSLERLEFPDGTIQTHGEHGLERAEDPFGNWVEVEYSNVDAETGEPLLWTITDVYGRSHTVTLSLRSYGGHLAPTVDTVELEAFGGETATYELSYGQRKLARPCNDPLDQGDTGAVTVPVLTGVSLPEDLEFTIGQGGYRGDDNLGAGCEAKRTNGFIEKLDLPSGGRHEWSWQSYGFPQASAERHPLTGQTGGGAPFRAAGGLATRTHRRRDGTELGTWTYDQELIPAPGTTRLVESRTTVNDPNGHETVHFFNVFVRDPDGDDPDGWVRGEYGLPFTRRVADGTSPERFLSREVYDTGGSHLRSVFARYEFSDRPHNQRLASRRTVHHDAPLDSDPLGVGFRTKDLDLAGFDGLGHYRRREASGNFPGTNARTTITNFNPGRSVSDIPAPSEPWILETFDRREVREGGKRFVRDFHFQEPGGVPNGFLERIRTRKSTDDGACSPDDVLEVRARLTTDADGNRNGFVGRVDLHGGGGSSLSCAELADVPLDGGTLRYRQLHRYTCGVLHGTQGVDLAGELLSFKSVDRDVDCDSGLVEAERDTAGLATTFDYDLLGRIASESPGAGEAKTLSTYANATSTSPARVVIRRQAPSGETLTRGEVELDGFGRVARELRSLPDGSRAERRTRTNSLGQVLDRGEWEPEGEPVEERSRTRFRGHDPFGRPGTVTLPDGQEIGITYRGESSRTIRVPVATDLDPSGEPVTENAQTLEVYDRFGRLQELREPPLADGSRTRTLYRYDGLDNLTRVDMNAGKSLVQTRLFSYDGRGFLTFESHPELGAALRYSEYDPLGNPGRVRRGLDSTVEGGWDLRHAYDAAGRLRRIEEWDTGRVWKEWTYATANGEAGQWSNGKLAEALRHNHVLIPGTSTTFDAEVRERYEYDGVGGRIARVVTDLPTSGSLEENTRPTFDYRLDHDPLGNVASRDYPECSHKFCVDVPDQDHTVTQSFTQGFLTAIPGYASEITYHPNGLVHRVAHANGVTDLQERDPDDMTRPRKLRTSGASDDFDSGVYDFDGAGNVTKTGSHRYVYDLLSRV